MVLHIGAKDEFDKETASGRVLVDFFATWCGPCGQLAPIVEKIAKEHPELKVLKVDVDEAQDLAAAYNVYSIPTLIYFENGKAVHQTVGYQPEKSLLRFCGIKETAKN
jgi:thioredoxin 1